MQIFLLNLPNGSVEVYFVVFAFLEMAAILYSRLDPVLELKHPGV